MDKLQKYNNKLLKYGNKLFKFDPPIYNVTILPSTNGSISATPVSGYSGTTITLSNTPDTGYIFDNYIVNGATLYDGNKFDLFKSNVTVQGNFKEPLVLYYSDLTENSVYNATITYNVDISEFRYCLVKFDEKATVGSGAGGLHIVFNGSSNNQWDLRCHWAWSSYHAIRQTNSTGFTKVNNTVSLNTRDGGYLYYWNSSPSASTYATHALLIDRNNNTCKHYLNGTYTGYGPLNAGTTLLKLTKNREQSSTYYNKNLYVYGGISEAVLQQYI